MTFETLVYINEYELEKDNIEIMSSLSGSTGLKYDENGEPEIWSEVNENIVEYFMARGYLNPKEAKEILSKADTIVLY